MRLRFAPRSLSSFILAVGMPAFLALTSMSAEVLNTDTEIWDATTWDLHGEQKSLAGVWDYVPWDDLSTPPDFSDARAMPVPVSQIPGAYRTKFALQSTPGEKRSILHFDAVAFRCSVFVNGREVGSHAGGMTPFEIDVTEQVHPGENELVVLVLGAKGRALSAESSVATKITYNERGQALVDGGDKTILGGGMFPSEGIRQGVYLREAPLLRISDATLVTSFRQKEFTAAIDIKNQSEREESLIVELDIFPYDIAKKSMGSSPVWTKSERFLARKGLNTLTIARAWSDAHLWMPGDPHLYMARIRVTKSTGTVLNERYVRFGFREVWIEGQRIMVNGIPLRGFVHGTIDAEGSPEVTRAMFKEVLAAGVNMVRPHTRPPLPSFAQIADEMGVAVIAEGELTFNSNFAYSEPIFWDNFERLHRERIARDKNHPSILLWSLANEVIICSPGQKIGQHFYDAFRALRQVDPTRPFMQEGDGDLRDMLPDSNGFPIDIINLHLYDVSPTKNPLWATDFPPIAWVLESVTEPKNIPATNKFGRKMPDRNRPWFVGEFGLAVSAAYPDFYSFWTGPEAYRDLFGHAHELVRALGEITELQLQAFRDMNMAGMDPWDMPDKPALAPYLKRGFEPVTIFTRDKTNHWVGGQPASRDLVTLNDSFLPQKLKLTIILRQRDKELARQEESFSLVPGARQNTTWSGLMPMVLEKTPVDFVVCLSDERGKQISGFHQSWLLFPEISPVEEWRSNHIWLCGSEESFGKIAKWSGAQLHHSLDLPNVAPDRPALVILDQKLTDALTVEQLDTLDRFVESGGVLMLQGVAQMPWGEDALVSNHESDSTRLFLLRTSPLTKGTTAQDWEFWWPDHLLSRGNYTLSFDPAYDYPLVGGGRNGPMYSPLAVLPKGAGAIIASRLELNESVLIEPVARIFLNNLADYAKSQSHSPKNPTRPTLAVLCPLSDQEAWASRLNTARIPASFDHTAAWVPGSQVVFLPGNSTPTAQQLTALTQFVRDGGTLWVHRLNPKTAFLGQVSTWVGQSLILRPPVMWLQQLELVSPRKVPPLLDGINDYMTCWATFGWTNGDMKTVRTTTIADWVIEDIGSHGNSLLREPKWIGTWRVTPDGYTLNQAILLDIGKHTKNEKPGIGLATFSLGRGRIIIDQLRWDDVLMDATSESQEKARYIGGTLWKNIGS